MNALITKEQAATYLGLKTPEAAVKLLTRLGVPKINFAIIGGKGIRYRRTDLEEALEKIEVQSSAAKKPRKLKRPAPDIFDLPIKEQMTFFLTENGPRQ